MRWRFGWALAWLCSAAWASASMGQEAQDEDEPSVAEQQFGVKNDSFTVSAFSDGPVISDESAAAVLRPRSSGSLEFLPAGDVFRPLVADPRQVRTFASAQRYDADFGNISIGSVGVGKTVGLAGRRDPTTGDGWQVSLAGAFFSFFELNGLSNDLISTDYVIGIPVTWKSGVWSARVNLFHQSSHVSGEYVQKDPFGPPLNPRKLSFEVLEAVGAWTHPSGARIYVSAASLVEQDNDLERLWFRVGSDYLEPQDGTNGPRWVAGVDLRWWEEADFDLELSAKAGLQWDASWSSVGSIAWFAEFFRGPLHHGQFYVFDVTYGGVGLQFNF